jgi:hypothetical protein
MASDSCPSNSVMAPARRRRGRRPEFAIHQRQAAHAAAAKDAHHLGQGRIGTAGGERRGHHVPQRGGVQIAPGGDRLGDQVAVGDDADRHRHGAVLANHHQATHLLPAHEARRVAQGERGGRLDDAGSTDVRSAHGDHFRRG